MVTTQQIHASSERLQILFQLTATQCSHLIRHRISTQERTQTKQPTLDRPNMARKRDSPHSLGCLGGELPPVMPHRRRSYPGKKRKPRKPNDTLQWPTCNPSKRSNGRLYSSSLYCPRSSVCAVIQDKALLSLPQECILWTPVLWLRSHYRECLLRRRIHVRRRCCLNSRCNSHRNYSPSPAPCRNSSHLQCPQNKAPPTSTQSNWRKDTRLRT